MAEEDLWSCSVCNFDFHLKTELRDHLKHIHFVSVYPYCDFCEIALDSESALEAHERIYHIGNMLQRGRSLHCSRCFTVFKTKYNVERHSKQCLGLDPNPCVCQYCPSSFCESHYLDMHISRTHFVKEEKPETAKIKHVCQYCITNFRNVYYLNLHIKRKHPERPKPGIVKKAPCILQVQKYNKEDHKPSSLPEITAEEPNLLENIGKVNIVQVRKPDIVLLQNHKPYTPAIPEKDSSLQIQKADNGTTHYIFQQKAKIAGKPNIFPASKPDVTNSGTLSILKPDIQEKPNLLQVPKADIVKKPFALQVPKADIVKRPFALQLHKPYLLAKRPFIVQPPKPDIPEKPNLLQNDNPNIVEKASIDQEPKPDIVKNSCKLPVLKPDSIDQPWKIQVPKPNIGSKQYNFRKPNILVKRPKLDITQQKAHQGKDLVSHRVQLPQESSEQHPKDNIISDESRKNESQPAELLISDPVHINPETFEAIPVIVKHKAGLLNTEPEERVLEDDETQFSETKLVRITPEIIIEAANKLSVYVWTCELCGDRFKLKLYLENHMKVHYSTLYYPCGLCPKTFASERDAGKHRAYHTVFKRSQFQQNRNLGSYQLGPSIKEIAKKTIPTKT